MNYLMLEKMETRLERKQRAVAYKTLKGLSVVVTFYVLAVILAILL